MVSFEGDQVIVHCMPYNCCCCSCGGMQMWECTTTTITTTHPCIQNRAWQRWHWVLEELTASYPFVKKREEVLRESPSNQAQGRAQGKCSRRTRHIDLYQTSTFGGRYQDRDMVQNRLETAKRQKSYMQGPTRDGVSPCAHYLRAIFDAKVILEVSLRIIGIE